MCVHVDCWGRNMQVDGVADAMGQLYLEFGEKFSQVFRSITTDNGSEFTEFSAMESLGTTVYFAHPYSAWERPVNERSNRLLRRFIPKGKSIDAYTDHAILMFADEINALPRKSHRLYSTTCGSFTNIIFRSHRMCFVRCLMFRADKYKIYFSPFALQGRALCLHHYKGC